MKPMLRFLRLFILAWAVLTAPQAALLHALSHSLPGGAHHQQQSDHRHQLTAKVCHACLAFAQLGAALPSRFEWIAVAHAMPASSGARALPIAGRHPHVFDARAPPAGLT
jgi:hypothetical protein